MRRPLAVVSSVRRPLAVVSALRRALVPLLRAALLAAVLLGVGRDAAAVRCAPDAVPVGPACIDRYEASVWRIPAGKRGLIQRLRRGRVTLAHLLAAGATQLGPFPAGTCSGTEYGDAYPPNGARGEDLYAVSVPGVPPSTCVTWFQAEQACRLSGKRLLLNQEWQGAAAGTPDPGIADDGVTTCATFSDAPVATGSRSACVSSWGTHDMVGNAWEWVAEWAEVAGDCSIRGDDFSGDVGCVGSATPPPAAPLGIARTQELLPFEVLLPGALARGGNLGINTRAGAFAVYSGASPAIQSRSIGFRCAR